MIIGSHCINTILNVVIAMAMIIQPATCQGVKMIVNIVEEEEIYVIILALSKIWVYNYIAL